MPKDKTPNIEDEQEVVPQVSPVCTYCSHILGYRSCDAFKEIPLSIWTGENKHTKPVRGDGGLLFDKWQSSPTRDIGGKI